MKFSIDIAAANHHSRQINIMHRLNLQLLIFILLLPLPSIADPAISPEKAVLRPLPSAQIHQIQSLGHAVLAAQASQTLDPSQEALRQELSALRQDIDQLVLPPTISTQDLKLSNGHAAVPGEQIENPQRRFDKSKLSAVQKRLTSVQQHRQKLETYIQEHASEEKAEQWRALPGAVAHLEDELVEALNAPDGPDLGKLSALRSRLQPKSYMELREEQERQARENGETIPEPTPTITTISHHR